MLTKERILDWLEGVEIDEDVVFEEDINEVCDRIFGLYEKGKLSDEVVRELEEGENFSGSWVLDDLEIEYEVDDRCY